MPIQLGMIIGVMVGLALSSQGAINGRLAMHAGGAVPAAMLSFVMGLSALVTVAILLRHPLPSLQALSAAPWWAFTGGLLGATVVACAAFFVPQIGVASWAAALIAGELLGAMVIDHHGWLSAPHRPVDLTRALGALLLAAGVVLIERGGR